MNLPLIQTLRGAKVLVTGDLMLDRYWSGSTNRVSPEAPVPVVKINDEYQRLGGCGNVAANISAVGGESLLLSAVGDDDAARTIDQLAEQLGVTCSLIKDSEAETTVKLRVISQQQQLLRLDFENGNPTEKQRQQLEVRFEQLLQAVDAVVISDYGKGGIDQPQSLIAMAAKAAVPVVVDPKGRDYAKYCGADVVTPNYREFEEVVGRCSDEKDIESKARALLQETGIKGLLITRGDQGMSLVHADQPMYSLSADAKEVFDVTGAGDTVCGVLATAIAAGCELQAAMALANKAAGIVVGKFGTATVSARELGAACSAVDNGKFMELTNAVERVEHERNQGARIVMTNGCFDVIHAGHVEYLQRAKALGNFLVVAVNSDASVTQLKGASRPINSLQNRLKVLAALESVDALIAFEQETPIELIEKISPDILVKGGDYQLEEIVGADFVRSSGGEVKILPFLQGLSSSAIIEKMEGGQ